MESLTATATKLTATAILQAATLGTIAFGQGRKAIPAHDRAMLDLMAKNQGHGLPLMKAYHTAWHSANASAAIA